MKKYTKVILSVLLCISLLVQAVFAAMAPGDDDFTTRIDSGTCNEYGMILWELVIGKEQTTLTISPKDDPAFSDSAHPEYRVMQDYTFKNGYSTAPWFLVSPDPQENVYFDTLSIESGINVIGEYSFKDQIKMTSVEFYPTLQEVNENAFSGCDNLTTIYFHGTKSQWKSVVINSGNEPLLTAEVIYDYPDVILGDVNDDGVVNDQDAIYLLFNTIFGDLVYPLNQSGDFNKDGVVNDQDAIYLLFHTLFGNDFYPL